MAARKKPEGDALVQWCETWDSLGHDEKLLMCTRWGITYETARHWRSDSAGVVPIKPRAANNVVVQPRLGAGVLSIKTGVGVKTAAILNDTHNPFVDRRALQAVFDFLEEQQPDYLFWNGDLNDFYQISSFDKNPARLTRLQADLDDTSKMLAESRRILPDSRIILLEGNHEDRLRRHLWSKDPQLSSLRCLDLDKLYGLDELEIEVVPYERGVEVNGVFLVIHGNIVGAHSSYTAKRMHDKHGGSGIHGHTHRGGSYFKRNRAGVFGWWENYCLCSLNPDWIKSPNWQQGFSLVHFKDDRFWVEQCQIIGGRFMYGGELYGTP